MTTIKQLLDYCAMQEKAILTFKASEMILAILSMRDMQMKNTHTDEWGGIFPFPMAGFIPPIIGPFSQTHQLSGRSCHWQWRRN